MGTQYTALEKRNWFIKRFLEAKEMGISISKEKIISEFCLTFYSKRQTATDFIKHFKGMGMIKVIEDEIIDTENNFDEYIDEVTGKWRDMSEDERKLLRMA